VKKHRNYFYIILLLASVIFVSACVQQRPAAADANNGLAINEFTADPTVAEPIDFVNFFLDVENVGGTTATCVRAQLFNVDSWLDPRTGTSISSLGSLVFSNVQLTPSGLQGQYCIGSTCYSTFDYTRPAGVSFTVFFDQVATQISKEFLCKRDFLVTDPALDAVTEFREELLPPDPARNRAGEVFTASWTLLPPTLPEGIQSDFRPTTRVSYIYKTTGQVKIPVFTRAEWRRRQDLGQSIDVAVIDNTNAPIKIAASRPLNPIIVNTDPDAITINPTERATFVLELQNVGDGFPTPAEFFDGKQGGFIFGTVILRGAGASFHDCLGVGPGAQQLGLIGIVGDQGEIVIGPHNKELLRMRSDNRAPFGCTIALERATWQARPFGTVELVFNLFYVYFIDGAVTVKVLGEESGTPGVFR